MNEDRPFEPWSSAEFPEQWAVIAEWEADRADEAEATIKAQAQEIDRLKSAILLHMTEQTTNHLEYWLGETRSTTGTDEDEAADFFVKHNQA